MKKENTESENLRHNVNVDTPALAGCVPRLDRASEVLPKAVGDSIELDHPRDPVGLMSLESVLNNPNIGTNHIGDAIIHSDLKVSQEIFERLTSDHPQIQP